jgi:hypothetical protein
LPRPEDSAGRPLALQSIVFNPWKPLRVSKEGIEALRARVSEDVALARRLRRIAPEAFKDEVRRAAAECGLDVADDDVDAAIQAAGKAWTLRWIR